MLVRITTRPMFLMVKHSFVGLPGTNPRHVGDLGNFPTQSDGSAEFVVNIDQLWALASNYSVLGRTIIIHERADDGSQPAGNAGGRIAQCVIGVANLRPENVAQSDHESNQYAHCLMVPATNQFAKLSGQVSFQMRVMSMLFVL